MPNPFVLNCCIRSVNIIVVVSVYLSTYRGEETILKEVSYAVH